MITVELAARLRDAGLDWDPRPADRFAIPIRGLDQRLYVVSEMTIETQVLETGSIVRFNGTTEWALDSIPQDEVIWLPHEAQLRDLLGPRFVRLEAVPDGFVVVLSGPGADPGLEERHVDIDAERAYARALLSVLRG
jgi:hypothetical protein